MRVLTDLFPFQECHHNMVQHELPSGGLSLSTLFSKMEEAARSLNVEDYSISQNTLDNVSSVCLFLYRIYLCITISFNS